MKKVFAIVANLVLGNSILWFFETSARSQDHFDYGLALGFSVAAVFLLLGTFRLIKSGQSLFRSMALAVGASFLVPMLGLMLYFSNATSLSRTLFGAFVGVLAGSILWEWTIPMFITNTFLFHWLSRR